MFEVLSKNWHLHKNLEILAQSWQVILLQTSGDEFKPGKSDKDSDDDVSSGVDENDISESDVSEPESPVKVFRDKHLHI